MSRTAPLASLTMCCVVLLTIGQSRGDTIVYSENFTSGASLDTLANPWTITDEINSYNFPVGSVPGGAQGILAGGEISDYRAVAYISLPASFNPTLHDYTLSFNEYVPTTGADVTSATGLGFSALQPPSLQAHQAGIGVVASNVGPNTEALYVAPVPVGGTFTNVTANGDANFLDTTVSVTIQLQASTGTATVTIVGAGGATDTNTQAGLNFASLVGGGLTVMEQGDGAYFSNVLVTTPSVPEPSSIVLLGLGAVVGGLALRRHRNARR